ncbi:MAG: C-GCAxxG-C-C family protein [Spirochaetaceae bacterium]|nr:C-GCAxxG-C-C family protein [Spirochaetaceae bacterium]
MNTKADIAAEIFSKGFNCAQAVFSSHSADFGVDATMAKKIAGAFGGGMAHNGEVCGAVTGAFMLIGLKYGKCIEGDDDSKAKTYKLASDYIEKFKKEFGSINCTDLLKYDLRIEKEAEKARELGLFKTLCPILVKRSVELVEEILEIV